MRSCGGEPVVMWRSEDPFSTIAFKSWCRFGISPHRIRRRVSDHFFDAGHADLELADGRHAQRLHAQADGLALQLRRGSAVDHELFQAVPERHHLIQRDAALVTAVIAGAAPTRLEDLESSDLL